MRPNSKQADLQLRWLRLKRHLRSTSTSARALRDAARALSAMAPTAVGVPLPARSRLCRDAHHTTHRLAA
jgi:hypothetical protein